MPNDNADNGDKTIKSHEKTEPIIFENWFEELHPFERHKLQYGPPDPFNYIRYIYHLTPDTIRAACADPKLRGMDLPTPIEETEQWEAELKNIIHDAAWMRETIYDESFIEDFMHYKFVRYYGGKAVVIHWNYRGEAVHQTIDEFKKSHVDRFVTTNNPKTGNLERLPFAVCWLKSSKIKKYEYVDFVPGDRAILAPDSVLNLWQGWPLRDDVFDDSDSEPEYCRLFLDHMLHNLCGGDFEVYIYLLGWMADALINTHRTSEVAIVMHGPQGSGKTLWAKCFMELFGKNHVLTLDKPDQVTGTHNKHLQDKCVVFADEAFFAGNRQHGATLKTLVTNEEIFIHPKFVDGFMAKKLFRIIIASNDEHVIRAEEDDRRYLVLHVDAGEHNQNGAYFGAVMDEWNSGGKQALFQWLRGRYWRMQLESGAWDVRLRPKTKALQKQKNLSLPKTQAIVHQMLHDGELPEFFDVDAQKQLVFVSTRLVAERNRLEPKDETALGQSLRVLAGSEAKSVRIYLHDGYDRRQYRGYWLPALTLCRERWEAHLKRDIEWPEDIVSWDLQEIQNIPF